MRANFDNIAQQMFNLSLKNLKNYFSSYKKRVCQYR